MRQPHLQSQHRPRLPPVRLFRQATILLEAVPRPSRSRAGAEMRTRDHLFRMAVHAAGESAAENGGRGGSRQGALRQRVARRMGRAKRNPSNSREQDDGFRKGSTHPMGRKQPRRRHALVPRSLVTTEVGETSVPAGATWVQLSGFAGTAILPR